MNSAVAFGLDFAALDLAVDCIVMMAAPMLLALLLSLLQANVIYYKVYNILRGGLLLRRPPAEETVSCGGGLLLRRPTAELRLPLAAYIIIVLC